MGKVARIDKRKADHIKINLERDVHSGLSSGLDQYRFIHEALPELDLEAIDTTLTLFGKTLNSPILISSMTGGTEQGEIINQRLAEVAQEMHLAMGVGSQRAALENREYVKTFSIVRKTAPDILLFANIGAIQLNNGYDIDHCQRAIDMVQADALCLHLNALQESIQAGGETNFGGLAKNIQKVCRLLEVPVIAKEVGWGISERTALILEECGVTAIDVAGAGGTSWSQVEMYRAPDEYTRQLAATFAAWGIPTAESILNVKKGAPRTKIIASGGLNNGLEIAKCLALGASIGGMAGPLLKSAAISSEKILQTLKLLHQQIKLTMFSCGAGNIKSLDILKIKSISNSVSEEK